MKKNSNIASIIAVSLAIVVILTSAAYQLFEVYKKTVRTNTGEAAKENRFLAMDRWLDLSGHKIRIAEKGDVALLKDAPEDLVLIFTSCFDFTDHQTIIDLVKQGKKIMIFYDRLFDDTYYNLSDELVKIKKNIDEENNKKNNEKVDVKPETDAEKEKEKNNTEDDEDTYSISDKLEDGYFLEIGDGVINIGADAYIMENHALENKNDIQKAWAYTGALDRDKKGIFIIRSKNVENGTVWDINNNSALTFWKLAAQKGALAPLVLSIIALIVFGFWMTLMPFGKYIKEKEIKGKQIRERFLAEGRFYKKYNLLNNYKKYFFEKSSDKNISIKELRDVLIKETQKRKTK